MRTLDGLAAEATAEEIGEAEQNEEEEEEEEEEEAWSEFDLPPVGVGGIGDQSRGVAQAKRILQEALRGGTEGIDAVRTMMDSQAQNFKKYRLC